MSFQAIEDQPIMIDLLAQANYTGWAVDGVNATHSSCQSGLCTLLSYPVTAGTTYQISYIVTSISGGNVQPVVGGTNGVARTTTDLYVEEVIAGSNGFVQFYSNANCIITSFNIVPIVSQDGVTLAYSMKDKGWSDFRDLYIDWGWSLFDRVIVASQGAIYASENNSSDTNNFFGVAYQSSIKSVFAKNPEIINTYEVLSYQGNMLLVSTEAGITTPTGQVTTLIDTDFQKELLTDGVTTVIAYQNENVYSASFKGNQCDDVINGDSLKGNYLVVELETVDGSTPLALFSIAVKTARSWQGNR